MKYIAGVRKENFTYFLKGPGGQRMYDSQLNGQPGKQVAVQNDCAIFETKSFEVKTGNSMCCVAYYFSPLCLFFRVTCIRDRYCVILTIITYIIYYDACRRTRNSRVSVRRDVLVDFLKQIYCLAFF